MATLSKEQIEQKLQKLQQLSEKVNALTKELVEAGAIKLSDEDLEKVDGGGNSNVLRTLISRFNDPKVTTTADHKKKNSNAFF